jgi:hypothetical protein
MNDVFPIWKQLKVELPIVSSDVLLCYDDIDIVYSAYYDGNVFFDTVSMKSVSTSGRNVYWIYAPKTVKELRNNKTEWKHDN